MNNTSGVQTQTNESDLFIFTTKDSLSYCYRFSPTDTQYWTSGTDAFHRGDWAFLLTAQPVMPLHWAPGENNTSPAPHRHCAALSAQGLAKMHCTHRLPYVCHIV